MPKNNNFLSYEEYQEKVANLRTASDVTNFNKELIAPTMISSITDTVLPKIQEWQSQRFGGLTPCEVLFMKTGVALKY